MAAHATSARIERKNRPVAALFLYPAFVFGALLLLMHIPFLKLPYFWDELGQFVPAALDLFRGGAWIPHSTTPNIHPPGVMAYLSAIWHITGYSIPATRLAMLALADVGLVFTFFLGIELLKGTPGSPAWVPIALLLVSPLFYTQAMMAQLDMPEMVFTVAAIWLFLRNRISLSAAACVLLVLSKETGLWIPILLAGWLVAERRWRDAAWYLFPVAALAGWLAVLYSRTGTIFGNHDFEHYNVTFQMNPVRLALALIRRVAYVLLEDFHWVGTAVIVFVLRHARVFRTRSWAICGTAAAGHLFLVSVLGGAVLERYVLPAMPFFYIAVAACWSMLQKRWRMISLATMAGGMIGSAFLNPPWPFPYENNLAMMDFVKLQQDAADVVEGNYPTNTVASAWPFPDAVRRPEFGYVDRPHPVIGISDFNKDSVLAVADKADVLVVYSRTWEPSYSILNIPAVTNFLAKYYYYRPQISRQEIETQMGFFQVAHFSRRGQWAEVYVRNGVRTPPSIVAGARFSTR